MTQGMPNAIGLANEVGQSIWLDSISRDLIRSGELARLVGLGVSGVTSNPTIFEKAVAEGASYDDALIEFADSGGDAKRVFESLAMDDIRDTADVLRPVYDSTGSRDGYVSIEVSPTLARDSEGTVEEARRLFESIGRPNVMIKVPGTPEGMPAVRSLIGAGINVNVTLLFSLAAYKASAAAYAAGLRDYAAGGGDPSGVASVASFFVSRVDTAADKLLSEAAAADPDVELEDLRGTIGIANARVAYGEFQRMFRGVEFADLAALSAQVQRPLWASTSVKNPDYADTMYVDGLMGPDTVNTVPETTLTALLEHGEIEDRLTAGAEDAQAQIDSLEAHGISLDAITGELLGAGIDAFSESWYSLLDRIEGKLNLLGGGRGRASLGNHDAITGAAVEGMIESDVSGRIWGRDNSVWTDPSPGAAEAEHYLGWLELPWALPSLQREILPLAERIRAGGFTDAVLLGMGGSSLASAVFSSLFEPSPGWLRLRVLDTLNPETVASTVGELDLARTIFLVASKSGTTAETMSLEKFFRAEVSAAGVSEVERHFLALSDPGSPLSDRASAGEFGWYFATPADVGGRYSAFTGFGLLPAALMGVDLDRIGRSALGMAHACRSSDASNPGLWLGATLGRLAAAGRDKVTLITSPGLERFGLWAEQLLAESTGKSGKGAVPVVSEPRLDIGDYGKDRQFVYLRLSGADNRDRDGLASELQDAGHPVIRLVMPDVYSVGAEFFRWEFSTVAAAIPLGVYPFDEPDVESAKRKALSLMSGGVVDVSASSLDSALRAVLEAPRLAGAYAAICAFLPESEGLTRAFSHLRRAISRRTGMATMFGYGPRYLHSTGQLYKGGVRSVLLLSVVSGDGPDLPIPEESYTLGGLSAAQAAADVSVMNENGRFACLARVSSDYVEAIEAASASSSSGK